MNSNSLVSIIIATKDRADLLPRAIQSAIEQTYRNIEIVIVDCSESDETENVVNGFTDARIFYQRVVPDPGRIESLDYGISHSRGEYICFLDDDDEFMPEKTAKQLEVFRQASPEVALVYTWAYYKEQNTDVVHELKPVNRGNILEMQLEKQSLGAFGTWMTRRSAYEKIGGLKRETQYQADWEIGCNICRYFPVDFAPEFLMNVYVKHNYLRMQENNYETAERAYILKEFHLYYLDKYKSYFDIYPKSRYSHYLALSRIGAVCASPRDFFRYFCLSLALKPNEFKNNSKKFVKGLYILIRSKAGN